MSRSYQDHVVMILFPTFRFVQNMCRKFPINVTTLLLKQCFHGGITTQMRKNSHFYLRIISRDQTTSSSRLKCIAYVDFGAY